MPGVISTIAKKVKAWKSRSSPHTAWVSRVSQFKYASFKELLAANSELSTIIEDLEEKLRGPDIFGVSYVRAQANRSVFHALRMVKKLNDLSGGRYTQLIDVHDRIYQAIKQELAAPEHRPVHEWVIPFSRVRRDMVDSVGEKNASLGELVAVVGLPAPEGFGITAPAYDFFMRHNDLPEKINRIRRNLDLYDTKALNAASDEIGRLIREASVPEPLARAILSAYDELASSVERRRGDSASLPRVALRSSVAGKDSELTYQGHYPSVLNVPREGLLEAYKHVVAGLYTPHAIAYRVNKGMLDADVAMAVACTEMVDSVSSGSIYSRYPSDSGSDAILIRASWGIGNSTGDGTVRPDTYLMGRDENLTVLETTCPHKPVRLTAGISGGISEEPVDADKCDKPCLSVEDVRTLAGYALRLEKHYGHPLDIEWALDPDGLLLVLRTRALHLEAVEQDSLTRFPRVEGYAVLVEGGTPVSPGVATGIAFQLAADDDPADCPPGAILIIQAPLAGLGEIASKIRALVGGNANIPGEAISVAGELGVPVVLAAKDAFEVIPHGMEVTVDAHAGRVYEGRVPELAALYGSHESHAKDSSGRRTLRRVADLIVPLHLADSESDAFSPESCESLHDIMHLAHELAYKEMFRISDIVSATSGAGAVKLRAPVLLDLRIIDLGGGLQGTHTYSRSATLDQVASIPLRAVLNGMLHEDVRYQGPRPITVEGFLSVMKEQMLAPNEMASRFGERSYALISDTYLNFSSRIGYHYSVLDAHAGVNASKNHISFTFKGGAADDVRRNRRARAIASIFEAFDFSVDVQADRVRAHFHQHERPLIEARLEMIGRLLQFSRQMDMLTQCEESVEVLAKSFLKKNYSLEGERICEMPAS